MSRRAAAEHRRQQSPQPAHSWPARHERLCVAALIVLHAALLGYAAVANSITFDEYAHLPAGLAYWRYGDFSIYSHSPPLLRLWAAVPALVGGASVPPVEPLSGVFAGAKHSVYAETFLRANFADYVSIFTRARWGMVPLSCLAAWIVYRWARELYGATAGLAACALYALCPNIAAHASLVTTDAGTVTALLAASWLWWRFCRDPSGARGAGAVAAIGLAHLCKFTALLLWPALIGMALWFTLTDGPARRRRRAGGLLAAGAFTLVLVNAAYGFGGSGASIGSYAFFSRSMSVVQAALPEWLPIPLPREFVAGFDLQKLDAEGKYVAFLFGERYLGSRWYYYPAALLCKLPLSTLALALLAAGAAVWRARLTAAARGASAAPVLWTLAVFGIGMVALADINIGIRYILPIFPLAFILISRVWAGGAAVRRIGGALLLTLAAEHAWIAPRYLTFVNLAAGGPSAGYRLLNDSNFDWGQGLVELKRWMRARSVSRIQLCYFGAVDPGVYGIEYTPLTEPGREAYIGISSYFLVGLSHRIPTPQGRSVTVQVPFFGELQRRPVAVVGGTIFIYDRGDVAAAIRAQQGGG